MYNKEFTHSNLNTPTRETSNFENRIVSHDVPHIVVSNLSNSNVSHKDKDIEILKEDFQLKIDNLEQQNYSKVIALSGESLSSISSDVTDYKLKVVDLIFEKTNNVIKREDIENITVIGRDRKLCKCFCRTLKVKQDILTYARRHKPEGIFFSEFLTSYRNKLYFEARQLKMKFPQKILTVYIRQGNIYYKVIGSNQYMAIRKHQDLVVLNEQFSNDSVNNVTVN